MRAVTRHTMWAALALAAGAGVFRPAEAQGERRVDPSPAELAIATGQLDIAEAVLFENIRRAPRQPSARGALGLYLASRARFQIGLTLFEEAIQFGGDSAQVESRLFEILRWSAQYDRAATLSTVRMAPEERESLKRAAGTATGGAATSTMPLVPNEAFGLGRLTITIGTEQVDVDVQPLITGLQLPGTTALFGAVEPIGGSGDSTFAVARTVAIGRTTLGPLPVLLLPSIKVGRIGLDVLAQLTPTFDFAAKTLTVGAPRVFRTRVERWPLLLTFPGVTFIAAPGTGPIALHSPAGRSAVRGTRWTIDLGNGTIVVER